MKQFRLEYYDADDGWTRYGTVNGTAETAWAIVDELQPATPDMRWQVIEVVHTERVLSRDGSDRALELAWAAWGTDSDPDTVTHYEVFKCGFESGRET